MQIFILKLWMSGATFDCGKYGSAYITPVERRENFYDVGIHVSPSYRKTREEAHDMKNIIADVISERMNDRTFEPDGTTNIESDIEELYALAYLEY